MSYQNRIPDPDVIFHSDQGIQYAIEIFYNRKRRHPYL